MNEAFGLSTANLPNIFPNLPFRLRFSNDMKIPFLNWCRAKSKENIRQITWIGFERSQQRVDWRVGIWQHTFPKCLICAVYVSCSLLSAVLCCTCYCVRFYRFFPSAPDIDEHRAAHVKLVHSFFSVGTVAIFHFWNMQHSLSCLAIRMDKPDADYAIKKNNIARSPTKWQVVHWCINCKHINRGRHAENRIRNVAINVSIFKSSVWIEEKL